MNTNLLRRAALAFAAVGAAATTLGATAGATPNRLWYDQPAVKWEEALPVGNGRLGAMVFGQPSEERLQLNEGTVWAGGPYDPVNPEAREALPQVRQLVNDGRYREAATLISAKVMAKPLTQMPYQTVGDLLLTFSETANVAEYRRELDVDTATATVSYTSDGVRYTREVFASAPDHVIVVHLTADKPGRLSFAAGMKSPMKATVETDGNDPHLAALYYQFGRYLLISCSRPGAQPATLQGLWNPSLNPPWQSKYTININTEMNYWPAESGNLAECIEPLIAMVNNLTVTGGRTARNMYGARGWMVHHNTDLSRDRADRRTQLGHVAGRRGLALSASLGSLRVQR